MAKTIIFGVLAGLFAIIGIVGLTGAGEDTANLVMGIIFVVLAVLFIILLLKNRTMRSKGIKFTDTLLHVTGLPVADGTKVNVSVYDDKVDFVGSGAHVTLDRNRIVDVSTKTETEIQNHVTSSIGGAVAGAVIAGPLGAIIGGRSKTTQTKQKSKFLIFTYSKDDTVEYIAFDVTDSGGAQKFVSELRNKETAKIEL